MSFRYVCIPANASEQIRELEASKSGGLENDELRRNVETYFSQAGQMTEEMKSQQKNELAAALQQQNGGKAVDLSAFSSVFDTTRTEIVALLLPCEANGFHSVSLYSDPNAATKGLPRNERAIALAAACNHNIELHGDVFVGRAHDDERLPWVRLDFTTADTETTAGWVSIAKAMNKGRNTASSSTSGVLQNMLKQQQQSAPVAPVVPAAPAVVLPSGSDSSGKIQWSQTMEELEVRIQLEKPVAKSAQLDIKIATQRLTVLRRDGQPIHSAIDTSSKEAAIVTAGGAKLSATVDLDFSTWTLDRASDGSVTIVITLSKIKHVKWNNLIIA